MPAGHTSVWQLNIFQKIIASSPPPPPRQPFKDGSIISAGRMWARPRLLKLTGSVAEPEPQGAASFGRSRSRNAMRLRLRQWY
jgi:hypothetical protein